MATYVMSDIHGQYRWFEKMLKKISFSDEDELYIIGDIIDRGPENLKMIDKVKNTPNIHLIMGNHEYMALDYYKFPDYESRSIWFNNGGQKTFQEIHNSEKYFIKDIIEYFSTLPFQKEIEVNGVKYVLTHSDPFADNEDDMVWHRISIFEDHSKWQEANTIYIVGHTPLPSIYGNRAEEKIYKSKDGNVWFIDYGCAYASTNYDNYNQMACLGCIRLDDGKLFIADNNR